MQPQRSLLYFSVSYLTKQIRPEIYYICSEPSFENKIPKFHDVVSAKISY
jgi:hypothetical protein